MSFSYDEFTTRNIGFLSEHEQAQLREATVFVCGVGGMGGSAVQSLIRSGVGNLALADIDEYEVSNLNRQVFCNLATVDMHKAQATCEACLQINPEANITIHKENWTEHTDDLVSQSDVVINGTDDLAASLLLYRTARAKQVPVIDAYASPLPSVYVTLPDSPTPEERLSYPTVGTPWNKITEKQRDDAFLQEALYVLTHSTSRHYIDLELAGEVAAGKRSRMSFAPMVINTGTLMAYEAIAQILNKPTKTNERGWFFNPYKAKVEMPLPRWLELMLSPLVKNRLQKLVQQ